MKLHGRLFHMTTASSSCYKTSSSYMDVYFITEHPDTTYGLLQSKHSIHTQNPGTGGHIRIPTQPNPLQQLMSSSGKHVCPFSLHFSSMFVTTSFITTSAPDPNVETNHMQQYMSLDILLLLKRGYRFVYLFKEP